MMSHNQLLTVLVPESHRKHREPGEFGEYKVYDIGRQQDQAYYRSHASTAVGLPGPIKQLH